MTALADAAADYLALRRRLGHDLADAHRLLPRFVAHLDAIDASTVTIEAAIAWSTAIDADPASSVWPRRMMVARGFARHMAGIDPATEVPPLGLLPSRQRWRPPFLFTSPDVDALMAEAARLRWRLPAVTHTTLIGLLAVTGMRIGEALKLDDADIDWEEGIVQIRESKFGKSRIAPLSPSTLTALDRFRADRDGLLPDRRTPALFMSIRGTRLIYRTAQEVFRRICTTAGIGKDAPNPPRIHDLRHSFAVNTLVNWHRNGDNVDARLPALSTYLGHRDPRSTYWYLSAAPELLALAARLIEPTAACDDGTDES
jgi:integrase